MNVPSKFCGNNFCCQFIEVSWFVIQKIEMRVLHFTNYLINVMIRRDSSTRARDGGVEGQNGTGVGGHAD